MSQAHAITPGNCASVPSAFSGEITTTSCSSVCTEVSAGTIVCNLKAHCDATSGSVGWLVNGAGAGGSMDYLFVGICDGGTTEFCCEFDDDSPSSITEMGITGTEARDYLFLSDDDLGVALAPLMTSVPLCGARGEQDDDFVVGTDSYECSDLLNGGEGEDDIRGRDGSDTLRGHGGSDYLHGNDGAHETAGNDGHDVIYGAEGDDFIVGFKGNDLLWGEDDHDTLCGDGDDGDAGGAQPPSLSAIWARGIDDGTVPSAYEFENAPCVALTGTNNDGLYGGNGDDFLVGGNDVDAMSGGPDSDILWGGSGEDLQHTGTGSGDYANGESGADLICGVDTTGSQDNLEGESSNDEIYHDSENAASVDLDGGPGTDFCNPNDAACESTSGDDCPITFMGDGQIIPPP